MSEPFLPYGHQWVDDEDIRRVVAVLRSDWLTQGPVVEEFEAHLAACCGARYAVAVANGTAALHLACLVAGAGPNTPVYTSTNTFVASANCALYCGARPYLLDIDGRTLNLSLDDLKHTLETASSGRSGGIVIPVHFAGLPCDMERLSEICRPYGMMLIEDAAHALGASWQDRSGAWHRVGSCSYSDMTVFSFHPVKHITTGEGGAILTNNPDLHRHLLRLRNHGISRDSSTFEHCDGPWHYEIQELGFNYRITDLQCALGLNQMGKLGGWLTRRREIARQYDEGLAELPGLLCPARPPRFQSAFHLYVIQLAEGRRALFEFFRARGIGVQVHYIPVHLHPYYQKKLGYARGDFPVAERYYESCLSLPIFPRMADADVTRVVTAIEQAMAG